MANLVSTFSSVDANALMFTLLFVIFLVLINFALSKSIFKREKASSMIISLCISLLSVYWLMKTNFNISRVFSKIGISEDILYLIGPWVILGLAILGSIAKDSITGKKKFRLYRFFMILGAMLIIMSFFAYERTFLLIAGIVLILLGIILWFRRKKKLKANVTQNSPKQDGKKLLIEAAKKFRKWAKSQPNPKFVGGWTYFVNYLKKNGWGTSEADICNKLNITQRDFTKIFNRYGIVK